MGVFHYQCAVSGLSVNGADCVAIWVCEVAPDTWVPASLPIRGNYNAYGTIDGLHRHDQQSWHLDRLRKWFKVAAMTDKLELRGDAQYAHERHGVDHYFLEGPLAIIERATTCHADSFARFGGKRIEQVLVLACVFDAIAAEMPDHGELDVATVLPCAFGAWLYQSLHDGEREQARAAFAAMRAFERFHTDWTPAHDPGQVSVEEFITSYLDARTKFRDQPWLMAAIDKFVGENELLYGEDLERRWLLDWGRSWYGAIIGDDRIVATSKAELVRLIDAELSYALDETLLAGRFLSFAVVAEQPQPEINLRPWITISLGSIKARLDQRDAIEDVLTSPGEPEFSISSGAFETLPELVAPLLEKGAEAVYFAGAKSPAWIEPDERYKTVFPFTIA